MRRMHLLPSSTVTSQLTNAACRLLPEKTWAGLQSALYSMELPTQPLQQTLQQLNGGLQQASSTSSSQQLGHSNSMQHVQVGASVDSCDLNRVGAELQQRRGRLSSIDLKLQQAAAQRPSTRPSSSRDNQAAGEMRVCASTACRQGRVPVYDTGHLLLSVQYAFPPDVINRIVG